MKLHWKGFGRKVYGLDLVLEWNSLESGETVYSLFHHVDINNKRWILFLRIPDVMWLNTEPGIYDNGDV